MDDGTNVIKLQRARGGASARIRSELDMGRYEIVTDGPSPEFGFAPSDPYGTTASTGIEVPAAPSASIGNARYLFLLARASFGAGEQGPERRGARLVGIRQYVELVARIPARQAPLASDEGPPAGATVVFRKEIQAPLWHPPDGSISWHVMVINKTQRDTRNPANAAGLTFQDATSPALLFQTLAPYTPPNGGRPWGVPIGASLGNIHDLRYRWRVNTSEYILDVPVPVPCDVALFASVRQNDPTRNPSLAVGDLSQQFVGLSEEDQFMTAYSTFAQYGRIAGALVFEENLGKDTP